MPETERHTVTLQLRRIRPGCTSARWEMLIGWTQILADGDDIDASRT